MKYIDIHTHRENKNTECTFILNILLNKDELPVGGLQSVGWHPWDADIKPLNYIEQRLIETSSQNLVIAIGECGIDKVISVPLSIQYEVFRLHIRIAQKQSKPLLLHCVKAYNEIHELIKANNYSGKFIFHSYNGNLQQTKQLLKTAAFFSFGKSLFNMSDKQIEVLKSIPINRLFLETDMSDEPIEKIYHRASEILGISLNELALKLESNYQQLFS